MRSLGDEIAVLDGLTDLPNEYARKGVIDASSGANYSGGSSFAPGLPLLPSNAGLADFVIPPEYSMQNVLDASAGANYSGGSSFAPGLPLLPSNAGLAGLADLAAESQAPGSLLISTNRFQQLINMIGAGIREDGVWGKKSADGFVKAVVTKGLDDEPDARAALSNIKAVERGRKLLVPTQYVRSLLEAIFAVMMKPSASGFADADLVKHYGIAAGVLAPRKNVIDASDGANYSGGSSFAPGLPLLPSNAGLADTYDGCPLSEIDHYWGSTMGVENTHYDVTGVLSASAGANYQGGSNFSPGLPLLPSNAGLAGLDAVSDSAFKKLLVGQPQMQLAFKRTAAKAPLMKTKVKMARLQKIAQGPLSANGRWKVQQALKACKAELDKQRLVRANIASGFRRTA